MGSWYSQRQTPSAFQPSDQTCVRALYGARSETTITVYNTATNGGGSVIEICGYAYQSDPESDPGRLNVV